MNLQLAPYVVQAARWPKEGKHILAQFDDESIVVYQAYRPEIGRFAAEHGYFGGEFKLTRMSWIKPNFLWMMHRCGWAQKEGQEVVLAVRIFRAAFDEILSQAVYSTYPSQLYPDQAAWKAAVRGSEVRLQFDPDHHPSGAPVARRAIQLGLRGRMLAQYAKEWIVGIDDISDWVREQQELATANNLSQWRSPQEVIYPVHDAEVRRRLRLDETHGA